MIKRSRQSGVALVSVLLMVTIILITISSLFYRHQLDITRASHNLINEQATLLALSSENWIQQILLEDLTNTDTDNLAEVWAYPLPVMNVEGGQLSGCVIDMQSKLNVNNLAAYSKVKTIYAELEGSSEGAASLLLRLFQMLEYDNPSQRVALISDWIDFDGTLNRFGGAEDRDYLLETPPRLAGNQPLSNIDELSSVQGFSILEMPVLKKLLVALPKATPINVNTAPAQVLMALIADLDEFLVEDLIELRPFLDTDEFYQTLADLLNSTDVESLKLKLPPRLVSVDSQFFQLKSKVELGGQKLLIQSRLYRVSESEIKVLQRQLIPLPTLLDAQGDLLAEPELCSPSGSQNIVV